MTPLSRAFGKMTPAGINRYAEKLGALDCMVFTLLLGNRYAMGEAIWRPKDAADALRFVYDSDGVRAAYASSKLNATARDIGRQRGIDATFRFFLPYPITTMVVDRSSVSYEDLVSETMVFKVRNWQWGRYERGGGVWVAEFTDKGDVSRYVAAFPALAKDWP